MLKLILKNMETVRNTNKIVLLSVFIGKLQNIFENGFRKMLRIGNGISKIFKKLLLKSFENYPKISF